MVQNGCASVPAPASLHDGFAPFTSYTSAKAGLAVAMASIPVTSARAVIHICVYLHTSEGSSYHDSSARGFYGAVRTKPRRDASDGIRLRFPRAFGRSTA